MKTLDELIETAPYVGTEWTNDALYYLKTYRRLEMAYVKALADIEDNPPLTWDELKTMGGKPVWVEVDEKWWGKFWAFVEVENDSYINFFQKGHEYPEDLWKRNMGKRWNAFRKERS